MAETATNPAEVLIDHVLALAWSDLPDATRASAKTLLHDTLCVGVAGAAAPGADAVAAVVASWGHRDQASVLGRPGLRLPAPSAAFLNAFQIHAQEFDCVHELAVAHPLATVAAVLMAECERSGPYSGDDVLAALAGGVDVVAGLGLAATTPLKFFRPATAGIFGCVAALGRLKRLPRETALDALGYALAFASGSMQAHVEGNAALPLQVANAARGAITAVDLAEAGLSGPRRSVDGPFGYLSLFETAYDLAPILANLGRRFRIAEVSSKPFPTGRAAHGGIVALQTLMREHGVTRDNLAALSLSAPPLIARLVGRKAVPGMAPAYARLCLPWLAAMTLTRGSVGLCDFDAEALIDPGLQALAARVVVADNGNPDPAAFGPATLTARTTDGREARVQVGAVLGSPARPLSRDQQLAKARACLVFGGLESVSESLDAMIDRFETLADATPVFVLAAGRR